MRGKQNKCANPSAQTAQTRVRGRPHDGANLGGGRPPTAQTWTGVGGGGGRPPVARIRARGEPTLTVGPRLLQHLCSGAQAPFRSIGLVAGGPSRP